MSESDVQVFPDSTGKKVGTLQVSTSAGNVQQQVMTIANERGDLMPTTEALTSFGFHRVASPITLFDSKFLYDKQPLFWAEALTGSGVSGQANAAVTMTVSGGTDSATRQTKQWFNYQSGKSQLIMMSGVFAKETSVTKRVGYFNGTDGIYLKVTGTTASWEILKSSAVSETVSQSSWNLDTMDGNGPSAISSSQPFRHWPSTRITRSSA
jgi:hypothetical protein